MADQIRQQLKDRYYKDADVISDHADHARQASNQAEGHMLEFKCPVEDLLTAQKELETALTMVKALITFTKERCPQ